MKVSTLHAGLLSLALLLGAGIAQGEPIPGGMMPELVGNLDEWSPAAGYLVLNGTRYTLAPGVALTTQIGEPLDTGALARGSEVGIIEIDGQVQRIMLFN